MSRFRWVALLAAVVTAAGVSGCGARDHGQYRFEHGDRIDRDGHREVRWCDAHRDDEHCR